MPQPFPSAWADEAPAAHEDDSELVGAAAEGAGAAAEGAGSAAEGAGG